MIIKKAEIQRFRGFKDVEFELGSQLTVIAGQNGTQKTTILGLLTQPFTITDSKNPMSKERPLSGGSFKSAFGEKFKLSPTFDLPKSHEWTLHVEGQGPFVVESIQRSKKDPEIRFWKKGNREAGSGYIQLPVIFLSLQRLLPIGEDSAITESAANSLSPDEVTFFKKWHKRILISLDEISDTHYLTSPAKNTLGVNTPEYDWPLNSAGQDNIGKILLAVMSFKRLKDKYPEDYKGGILAIDELDAVLYPGSQIQLFNALRTFSSKYQLQIIFTTHSLTLLDHAFTQIEQNSRVSQTQNQIKVIYLEKENKQVIVKGNLTMASVRHRLNVSIDGEKSIRIQAYTEDKEAQIFTKALLKSKGSKLSFLNAAFSCSSLVGLGSNGIPSFSFPESIVFLDGDTRSMPDLHRKVKKLKNFIILPGAQSPERLLANYLYRLPDDSPLWRNIHRDYTKQLCFKNFDIEEIEKNRDEAKKWFNNNLELWGKNAAKVFNPWMKSSEKEVQEFLGNYIEIYNSFAIQLGLESLEPLL